jgi:hypothetical protein
MSLSIQIKMQISSPWVCSKIIYVTEYWIFLLLKNSEKPVFYHRGSRPMAACVTNSLYYLQLLLMINANIFIEIYNWMTKWRSMAKINQHAKWNEQDMNNQSLAKVIPGENAETQAHYANHFKCTCVTLNFLRLESKCRHMDFGKMLALSHIVVFAVDR